MAPTTLDEETTKKVIRQVEFYFGDSNLATDSFLLKSIEEGEDGMVSLALICSFSRMKGHLGLGNLKVDEIPEETVKAVAEVMKNSEVVKISDDGTKVGRRYKLRGPEELIEQIDSRTLAASPLPYNAKLEAVDSFFSQYAKVNSVRLPSHVSNKKLFCGTALIEFSAEEDLEKITGQNVVYEGVSLEFKPKKEFDTEREAQEAEFAANPHNGSQKKDSAEANYPKGLIVAFKLKRKSTDDSPKENMEVDNTSEVKEGGNTPAESKENASDDSKSETETKEGKDDEKPSEDTKSETETKESEDDKKPAEETNGKDKKATNEKYTVENCKDDMDVVLREDLKAVFEKYGVVKYVDFRMGAESGFLRFEEAEAAQKARAAAVLSEESGIAVKNFIATLEPVTGDAEKEYWKQFGLSRDRFKDNRGHRGRGGKNHRGWKQGRSRDDDSGGRSNKIQKVAA